MEGGGTKREHLERIEKQTGKQQIPEFEIPIEGEHLWNWFWQLSNRRPQGFGASLIPYSEYKSWLEVRKLLIHDWEIEILTKMDEAFLEGRQETQKEKKQKKTEKQGSR
jgi:DNA-dependent RNA polymerase auxiliary subunit epsilon